MHAEAVNTVTEACAKNLIASFRHRVSGGAAVLMMQTADGREGDDRSLARWLDRAWLWALFVQRKMRSRLVIVRKVGAKSAFQVHLIEDDDVIDALAPY